MEHDEPHELLVQEPGGWRSFPHLVVRGVRPGPRPIEVRLDDPDLRTGRVAARFVGPDGPARDARLVLWHVEERLWRDLAAEAATGELLVERVPPGTLELEVRSTTHPWRDLGAHALAAGETLDLGRSSSRPAAR